MMAEVGAKSVADVELGGRGGSSGNRSGNGSGSGHGGRGVGSSGSRASGKQMKRQGTGRSSLAGVDDEDAGDTDAEDSDSNVDDGDDEEIDDDDAMFASELVPEYLRGEFVIRDFERARQIAAAVADAADDDGDSGDANEGEHGAANINVGRSSMSAEAVVRSGSGSADDPHATLSASSSSSGLNAPSNTDAMGSANSQSPPSHSRAGAEILFSDAVVANGLVWRLKVYPNGSQHKNQKRAQLLFMFPCLMVSWLNSVFFIFSWIHASLSSYCIL